MGSILLHVAHPAGSVDVLAADDEAVEALLPGVLAAAGLPSEESSWHLAAPGGIPLTGAATLAGAAIASGSTIQLLRNGQGAGASPSTPTGPPAPPSPAPPLPHAPALPPAPVASMAVSPWQRTRGALPPRPSLPARLGLAAQAWLRPRRDESLPLAPDPVGGPTPEELTRARRLGPVARARATFHESDYMRSLEARIVGPRLVHCATIAVVSPKGGVGKTTITALLGTLLAQLRRDRIVAIDTNPDYGSLGRTLAPAHTVFVDDLLGVLDHPALTVTQLDTSLARGPHGLLVLPAPTAPERMARLDQHGYGQVIQKLQKLVSVILLDCGTGLWEPAAQVALAAANQVVLVSDAEPATASLVAEASQQLRPLDVPVTLVVNRVGRGGHLDIERFAQSIRWAQSLVTLADDRSAAASIALGGFDWDRAPRGWRRSVRELATVIAADWNRIGLTL